MASTLQRINWREARGENVWKEDVTRLGFEAEYKGKEALLSSLTQQLHQGQDIALFETSSSIRGDPLKGQMGADSTYQNWKS